MLRRGMYFFFILASIFFIVSSLTAFTSNIKLSKVNSSFSDSTLKEWKEKASFNEYCLSCHKLDITKKLKSKEILNLKVNLNEIKQSVHRNFQCIVCHHDYSKTKHPIYNFSSKKEYAQKLSRQICQKCHTDQELRKNPVHYNISKTAPCVECHGYHGVKPAKIVKGVPENQYCLACHSRNISKRLESGEVLFLRVDISSLTRSAHKDLKCSDCHKGYSQTHHPIKKIASLKEYRKESLEICKQCHVQEHEKYVKSIHAKRYFRGDQNSPNCIKCHDYHGVMKISHNSQLKLGICTNCHTKEMTAYQESIHYKVFTENKPNAPVCSSCHNAHDVLSIDVANLNNSCLVCHKDVKTSHNKWLYNPPFRLVSFVETHFRSSSCAACHADGNKTVTLKLIKKENKEALSVEELAKILKVSPKDIKSQIDLNNNNFIEEKEFWSFVRNIKQSVKVDLKGRIDMSDSNEAHKILGKDKGIRECSVCHHTNAKISVAMQIPQQDEKPLKLNVEKAVINTSAAIPNIRDFYILSFSRIKILDVLFVCGIICGIGVGLGHLVLRIITKPIRRKRKEEGR